MLCNIFRAHRMFDNSGGAKDKRVYLVSAIEPSLTRPKRGTNCVIISDVEKCPLLKNRVKYGILQESNIDGN